MAYTVDGEFLLLTNYRWYVMTTKIKKTLTFFNIKNRTMTNNAILPVCQSTDNETK